MMDTSFDSWLRGSSLVKWYHSKHSEIYESWLDPRTRDWMFIGTPWYTLITCGGYLLFVYSIGPRMMKNRQPFHLRRIIQAHNLFMMSTNAWFCVQFLRYSYLGDYSLFCQGMTYSTDKNSLKLLSLSWFYLLLRTLDFLDTGYFILRKKFSHVTFQHVSHHFCCIFSGHIWLSLGADGQPLFGLCFNSATHVLMHFYYFLASLGPKFHKHLWWKKHLTKLQIYQHFIVISHGLIPMVYFCNYPRFYFFIAFPQGILGLVLFLNFYAKQYGERKGLSTHQPEQMTDRHDAQKLKDN